MEYSLYVVGTPIGNLKDVSYRAIQTLNEVDFIACEDTRHSLIFLNEYGIKKKLLSFHKYNIKKSLDEIVGLMKNGSKVALITDAGMPCVSDPGIELVRECIKENIPYTVIGGVTAFLNALILSGFNTNHFMFIGFLPEKDKDRKELIGKFKNVVAPLIFYAAPHNLKQDLADLYEVLGDREVALVKEISKMFENVKFVKLGEELDFEPKGEYVVIVKEREEQNPLNSLTIKEHLLHYINSGMDKKEAVKQVAKDRDINKNEVYKFSFDI